MLGAGVGSLSRGLVVIVVIDALIGYLVTRRLALAVVSP
jgi:hypothetical protein